MTFQLPIFVQQLNRYLASIFVLLKELFAFKPKLLTLMLVFTFLGTTIQGFSLGSTFFILKHTSKELTVDVGNLIRIIPYEIHISIVFTIVLLLFGFSIYFIFKSQELAIQLAELFANQCGSLVIENFIFLASQLKDPSVNIKTGVPTAFKSEISQQCQTMMIACRLILRLPTTAMQLIYGSALLLWVEPLLAMIVAIASSPLVILLRRLALRVKNSEMQRKEKMKLKGRSLQEMVIALKKRPIFAEDKRQYIHQLFSSSAFAESNRYRAIRLISKQASQAIAGTALIITGITSIFYFWITSEKGSFQVATVIVFFGALKMTAMSIKQISSLLTGFARFYEPLLDCLNYRSIAKSQMDDKFPQRLKTISGLDIENNNGQEIKINTVSPIAVIGAFPLSFINLFTVSLLFQKMNKKKSAELISKVEYIDETVELNENLLWMGLFENNNIEKDVIKSTVDRYCSALTSNNIGDSHGDSISSSSQSKLSQKQALEALLVRAKLSKSQIIYLKESSLILLSAIELANWVEALSEKIVLIYYQYNKQSIGLYGESYAVMLGKNGTEKLGIAVPNWVNSNSVDVQAMLTLSNDENVDGIEDFYDDDDDDDDE
jgi:hypothetical protein